VRLIGKKVIEIIEIESPAGSGYREAVVPKFFIIRPEP
jgi:hypothetical protein